MMAPPVGTLCADCKVEVAAVMAGSVWVCWGCDEKASQAPDAAAFEISTAPVDGVSMSPEYRYDEPWSKLKAGMGREDVVMRFTSRLDAKRATFALRKRAQMAGVRLVSKRVGYRPLTMRYRLKTESQ